MLFQKTIDTDQFGSLSRFFFLILLFTDCLLKQLHGELLPSWNEGQAKATILQFINETTKEGGNHYIPVGERIAVFDEDGTLWVEKPIYTEIFFAIEYIKSHANRHPEWKTQEPFRSVLADDKAALSHLSQKDVLKIIAASHAGITIDNFHKEVADWLEKAEHPRFERPFTQLIYQPMLEVMELFRTKQFKIYICSGGGQEFIRSFSEKVYGIPPERVIGTASKTKFEYRDGHPVLMKVADLLFINDKSGKPEGINLIIGKRPVAAFGNSTGDREMLEWTQGGKGKTLELLVHHDDPVREYAYGPDSKIGTFSVALEDEAKKKDWIIVSMKNDWKVIFPFEEIK